MVARPSGRVCDPPCNTADSSYRRRRLRSALSERRRHRRLLGLQGLGGGGNEQARRAQQRRADFRRRFRVRHRSTTAVQGVRFFRGPTIIESTSSNTVKQDMKRARVAKKGRVATQAAAQAAQRRGSVSKPPIASSALTPLGMSKPPVTLSPSGYGRGKAPASVGTPTPAKAVAMAAAGKAHPAVAGAVPPAAAKAAPAAQGADAFIYEEYGFPSAAEPAPAANPLLIFSVLVSYFLFVAACFLIIKRLGTKARFDCSTRPSQSSPRTRKEACQEASPKQE
ncbi:hypothetical protein MTO96_045546 [Rhipicephalus appendiculatus]